MININSLNSIEKGSNGIEVWGFTRNFNDKGSIILNALTYPLYLQNISFNIQCYYADGFVIDYNKNQGIIPINREDIVNNNERKERCYGINYFPLHEFYFIPRTYVVAVNQEVYVKLNENLRIFEKIINDFYLTREEIIGVEQYIKNFFYRQEYFDNLGEKEEFKKYDLL